MAAAGRKAIDDEPSENRSSALSETSDASLSALSCSEARRARYRGRQNECEQRRARAPRRGPGVFTVDNEQPPIAKKSRRSGSKGLDCGFLLLAQRCLSLWKDAARDTGDARSVLTEIKGDSDGSTGKTYLIEIKNEKREPSRKELVKTRGFASRPRPAFFLSFFFLATSLSLLPAPRDSRGRGATNTHTKQRERKDHRLGNHTKK